MDRRNLLNVLDVKIDHRNDGLVELKHPLVVQAPSLLLQIMVVQRLTPIYIFLSGNLSIFCIIVIGCKFQK